MTQRRIWKDKEEQKNREKEKEGKIDDSMKSGREEERDDN